METDYAAVVHDGTMWIAEDHDRLLAFIVLVDAGDHLFLDSVAVDPAAQGRGHGGLLLALAKDEGSAVATTGSSSGPTRP